YLGVYFDKYLLLAAQLRFDAGDLDLSARLRVRQLLSVVEQLAQIFFDIARDGFSGKRREEVNVSVGGFQECFAGNLAQLAPLLPDLTLGIDLLESIVAQVELAVDFDTGEHGPSAGADERPLETLDAAFMTIESRAGIHVGKPARIGEPFFRIGFI